MPRIHAFEILDFSNFPANIRNYCTDYLQFIIRASNAYAPVAQPIARVLDANQVQHIVDLCSGGGGPWPQLRAELLHHGAPPNVTVALTDAYPNHHAFANAHAQDQCVKGIQVSVAVEDFPEQLRGFRTMFSSFHHFNSTAARHILNDAIKHSDGIAIAEITQRSVFAFALVLVSPLLVWLATPRLRPFRWSRLLWTYLIPVVPFVVCFDGVMSCLRTYSPSELRTLISQLDSQLNHTGFDWEIGEARGRALLAVTYAIGTPRIARLPSGPTDRDF